MELSYILLCNGAVKRIIYDRDLLFHLLLLCNNNTRLERYILSRQMDSVTLNPFFFFLGVIKENIAILRLNKGVVKYF